MKVAAMQMADRKVWVSKSVQTFALPAKPWVGLMTQKGPSAPHWSVKQGRQLTSLNWGVFALIRARQLKRLHTFRQP